MFLSILPLLILVPVTALSRDYWPPWLFMWLLAFSIFAGCKFLSFWEFRRQCPQLSAKRAFAYLFAWPGMDAHSFFSTTTLVIRPVHREWLSATLKFCSGLVFFFVLARAIPVSQDLMRGWMGMIGIVLVLHFGSFHLLSLFWRRQNIPAEALFNRPLASTSLADFWGDRWNRAFRNLGHQFVFRPLSTKLGKTQAALAVFILSGLIHDFVISFPARAGYGLPTLYFIAQGFGIVVEKSVWGKARRLSGSLRGWCWIALFTAGPAFFLFHPPFIREVILPMMRAFHAL